MFFCVFWFRPLACFPPVNFYYSYSIHARMFEQRFSWCYRLGMIMALGRESRRVDFASGFRMRGSEKSSFVDCSTSSLPSEPPPGKLPCNTSYPEELWWLERKPQPCERGTNCILPCKDQYFGRPATTTWWKTGTGICVLIFLFDVTNVFAHTVCTNYVSLYCLINNIDNIIKI